MYRINRNNYHAQPKRTTIYTPSQVSQFLFELLQDKFPQQRLIHEPIFDPCCGKGSLLTPWKEGGYYTSGMEIDFSVIEPNTYRDVRIRGDFLSFEKSKFQPALILCNPPWNGYGQKLGSEIWLDKIIELFGEDVPLVLFAPMGFRLNGKQKGKRWNKFTSFKYPPISSIISLPRDIFPQVEFHSEILIFNIQGLEPHYFFSSLNNLNNKNISHSVGVENNALPKTKQQINQENYQKNKEKLKAQQKINYAKKKQQALLTNQRQAAQYYEAESIRVLMSLPEYIDLNSRKKKLWANFCWTWQDFKKVWESGNTGIIPIMKLRESAESLINDYWATAKNEVKKGKSWNSLSEEKQQRFFKYWGYEKARLENNYLSELERLEQQSQAYLKEIELVKFHEERGKINCACWQCETQQGIRQEIKKEQKTRRKKEEKAERLHCEGCNKLVEELEEVSGVCSSCAEKYE